MRPATHAELHAELAGIRRPLTTLDGRLAGVESGLVQLDKRVAGVETGLVQLDKRVAGVESGLARLDERVKSIETHGATKTDLAALEIRLLDRMDKNFRWMIGTTIVLASVIIAGIGVVLTVLPQMITP